MIGYNIYLKGECDENGYEEDPYFLRLSYGTYSEAETIKEMLEIIYGTGQIFIDAKSSEINLWD